MVERKPTTLSDQVDHKQRWRQPKHFMYNIILWVSLDLQFVLWFQLWFLWFSPGHRLPRTECLGPSTLTHQFFLRIRSTKSHGVHSEESLCKGFKIADHQRNLMGQGAEMPPLTSMPLDILQSPESFSDNFYILLTSVHNHPCTLNTHITFRKLSWHKNLRRGIITNGKAISRA